MSTQYEMYAVAQYRDVLKDNSEVKWRSKMVCGNGSMKWHDDPALAL
jgi:hypothetical protein